MSAVLFFGIWLCLGGDLLASDVFAQDADDQYCGPDLTDWLVEQMNINAATEDIQSLLAARLPLNIASTVERMEKFAYLVGPGKQWDHKPIILALLRAGLKAGGYPTSLCSKTITLCGACYDFDVPSNIHYSYIGRQAGFTEAILIVAPLVVQDGATEIDKLLGEASDTPAIQVGLDIFREIWWLRLLDPLHYPWPGQISRDQFCRAVQRRSFQLATGFVAPQCQPCEQAGTPK